VAKRIDLTGKRFGRLVVIEEYGRNKHRSILWRLICDCGKITIVASNSLRSGHTCSCGCLNEENLKKGITKKDFGVASFNAVYGEYKRSAKKRGYSFDLNEVQFKELIFAKCFYCDSEPHNITNISTRYGTIIYNGIDRVDNERGYIIDNVVTCCGTCNMMKRTYTKQEFVDHIEKIYNHLHKES